MSLSRRHFMGLAGLAGAAALTGCAGGTTSAGSGSSAGAKGGSGPLQFWSNHPASSKDVEQSIIDSWNKANPDSQVQLIDGGKNYEEVAQKVNASLSGSQLPDIFVASDVTWFNFALTGATAPLDELWTKAGINTDSYVTTLREDYAYEGKHYGMPYSRSTCIMYLNTDVLAKAGIDAAQGPQTWQEFAQWAPKIKAALGGKPALAIPDGANYLDWYFQGMAWTFGGHYSDKWTPTFTSEGMIKAGQFLADQVKQGHIIIGKDAANTFGIGNAGGLLESTGSLAGLTRQAQFKFKTYYLPGPKPGCPTGGAGLAIPAGISDERKLKAVKFIDFMTNTANTITFTQKTGYMPVRKDALTDAAEQEFLKSHPNAETAIKQLNENTAPQDYARVFVPGGGKRIGAALDKITNGGQDIKTVFEALQAETQATIDREIKPKLKK